MPKDIDSYVHRIGRTGRKARKGIATTFINKDSSELILRDLKCLLKEARQQIPPLLHSLEFSTEDNNKIEIDEQIECIYCSGLGHKIVDCSKLYADRRNEFWKHEGNTYTGVGANM
jgi:ATP-dependent RNA helicase DDX41